MRKYFFSIFVVGCLLLSNAANVFAHVTVKPAEVNVGTWQTFSVGVPVEKDLPTTGLRLVIPSGVEYVTPNVKPGWKISVKKDGDNVTEISWNGGLIPAGQRDDFLFSAHVPAVETKLQWKAYQTYQDGSVVSWDREPSVHEGSDTDDKNGPYSVTQIVNDLKAIKAGEMPEGKSPSTLSLVALALSSLALLMQLMRKK